MLALVFQDPQVPVVTYTGLPFFFFNYNFQGYKHQTRACESQHLHGLLSRNLHKVSVNDCGEFSESLQLARVQCFMNSGKCGKNCREFYLHYSGRQCFVMKTSIFGFRDVQIT